MPAACIIFTYSAVFTINWKISSTSTLCSPYKTRSVTSTIHANSVRMVIGVVGVNFIYIGIKMLRNLNRCQKWYRYCLPSFCFRYFELLKFDGISNIKRMLMTYPLSIPFFVSAVKYVRYIYYIYIAVDNRNPFCIHFAFILQISKSQIFYLSPLTDYW